MTALPHSPTHRCSRARFGQLILAAICATFWLGAGSSAGSYGAGSPVPSATVPPSTYESGLTLTPNPIDTSGNQVVTGNIAGGRHFRGSIPYSSTTGFRAPLGTSSLDSFLRYSGDPEDFGYSGQYRPFYSPSGTVTTTQPGTVGVFAPSTTKIIGRAPDIYAGTQTTGAGRGLLRTYGSAGQAGLWAQEMQSAESLRYAGPQTPTTAIGNRRPMSRTPQELEAIILNEFPADPPTDAGTATRVAPQPAWDPTATPDRDRLGDQQKIEQFRRKLAQIRQERADLEQKLAMEGLATEDFSRPRQPQTPTQSQSREERLPVEPTLLETDNSSLAANDPLGELSISKPLRAPPQTSTLPPPEVASTQRQPPTPKGLDQDLADVLSRMGVDGDGSLQDSAAKKVNDADALARRAGGSTPGSPATGAESLLTQQPGRNLSYAPVRPDSLAGSRLRPELLKESPIKRPTALEQLEELSPDEIANRAQQIMGSHKSLASFSQAKFDQYIEAGRQYLAQGKYYRAADAYAMASIYKPDDPAANAGRSHALFAAGEYISSALFLSRALQVYPEYALLKIDIVAVVGGKDKLDDRILDIQEGIEISDYPELRFLLAYVYYQVGAAGPAREQIDAAFRKLPDSPAVLALRKAVYAGS
ncbi:MAG: hypothetical protein JSU70_00205 [Phycisphaerales bacterium]|nr:MAG: hypothetical protein JSU70_00205 [Phycisphaerales bacterium]